MNSFGYSRHFLTKSVGQHANDVLETGWSRIFDEGQMINIHVPFPTYPKTLRFTLDYNEDYQFFSAVIKEFGNQMVGAQDKEIVNLVMEKKLYLINEGISKQYWENFYRTQEKEKQVSCNKD